jgi:hypothetical protein
MKAHADEVVTSKARPIDHGCTCRYVVVHESFCDSNTWCIKAALQNKRRRFLPLEALLRVRGPEPQPHEPLVAPGAVPGAEGRLDDIAARTVNDLGALFSRMDPLDPDTVNMDALMANYETLWEIDRFGMNVPNVLARTLARISARTSLDAARFKATHDKARPHVKP